MTEILWNVRHFLLITRPLEKKNQLKFSFGYRKLLTKIDELLG